MKSPSLSLSPPVLPFCSALLGFKHKVCPADYRYNHVFAQSLYVGIHMQADRLTG